MKLIFTLILFANLAFAGDMEQSFREGSEFASSNKNIDIGKMANDLSLVTGEPQEVNINNGNIDQLKTTASLTDDVAQTILSASDNRGKFDDIEKIANDGAKIINRDINQDGLIDKECSEAEVGAINNSTQYVCETPAPPVDKKCEEHISNFEVKETPAVYQEVKHHICGIDRFCVRGWRDWLWINQAIDHPSCPSPCRREFTQTELITPRKVELVKEQTSSTCGAYQADSRCREVKRFCTSGEETKTFHGEKFTRCWHETIEYQCQAKSRNNCTEYNIRADCKQINSKCISLSSDNKCDNWEQTYVCGESKPATKNKVCTKKTFCIEGDCVDANYQPNGDMANVIAQLGVFRDIAGSDIKNLGIFSGKAHTCTKAAAGFNNCCVDNGWGQDIKLAKCNEEEKNLGLKKESGRCHYIGSFCSRKAFGMCLQHKQSYCCFDSKLLRVMQQQGRSQLGMNFGDGENPVCTGFTHTELAQIDFRKINFSEVFADIMNSVKQHNVQNIKEKIINHFEKMKGELK